MTTARDCRRYKVYGLVQGVGFRPFVARLARELGLVGTVCNRGSCVEIRVSGTASQLDYFADRLRDSAPPRANVLRLLADELPPFDADAFDIIESAREPDAVYVSPDIALCANCRRELWTPTNPRYQHPFINCTDCGPRFTIIREMPYDRERTTMSAFPMCKRCRAEYRDPRSRRYDAQPVCCPDCGPELSVLDGNARGLDAIVLAQRFIDGGGLVAVKGIGGFHLCCDATNATAVARLRERKHRPAKPLAVMLRDLETARRECELDDVAVSLLTAPQGAIVLLPKRNGGRIVDGVAPGNPKIGVMLPYTPLHELILHGTATDALVLTSGNPSGAPICRDDDEAREHLAPICRAVLTNNRPILVRADDSVVDVYGHAPYMVRRSRGYAPLPVCVDGLRGSVLALGADLKNTICLSRGGLCYPSAYIGDMSDLRTVNVLRETAAHLGRLLEIRPQVVACDLHPRYNTTLLADECGLPVRRVQHHHAHIVSCMAENGVREPVIGVALDGTGYGDDGSVWGGEFLLADARGYRRLGSIEPFRQTGGDLGATQPWRMAVNLLTAACGGDGERVRDICGRLRIADAAHVNAQRGGVPSTSAGRLFDAVASLLGLCQTMSFEGEAAMRLQFAADRAHSMARHPLVLGLDGERFALPTLVLLREIAERRLRGDDVATLATHFHEQLALMIVAGCRRAREMSGVNTVALSGGVWQNTLLLGLVERGLLADGFAALRHHLHPTNDGGIALGQCVIAGTLLTDP